MLFRSASVAALRGAVAAALVSVLWAPLALAEGPGYGGTADTLTVAWVSPDGVSTDSGNEPGDSEPPVPDAPPVAPEMTDTALVSGEVRYVSFGGGPRSAGVVVRISDEPALSPDKLALQINGLGFRGNSEVTLRIGNGAPITSRSDTAGSLSVAIDPALLGATQPGLTVVAIGRRPSGTAVTLYGSVPPEPSGAGPMSIVPWVAAGIAAVSGIFWMRRRREIGRAHV